jgi:hypothetical protein
MAYTRKQRRAILRVVRITLRLNGGVDDELAAKWSLRQHIDACTEDGKIAVCRSGMDCDCTQYASVRIVPAPLSVLAWVKAEDEHQRWLDGHESTWIDKPSSHDGESYRSADRALEAYEDGRPSTIYWGDL